MALPVIQSQSGTTDRTPGRIVISQKSVYNAPKWQFLPKSADHLQPQTSSRDVPIVPDHWDQLPVFWGCGQTPPTFTPPLMWPTSVSVTSKHFADAYMRHSQHADHFSLRVAQYNAPVFALANYAAWCPQRMIVNANNLARNVRSIEPSIVQTSPKVSATWVTSIPVSSAAVLSGLTGIHHSIG